MIGLIHLVWGPLGREPLARFLDSYRRYDAGADHELTIVWNATPFDQREELAELLEGLDHRSVALSEPVQDLAAYRLAADQLPHDHLCVLNSHTEVNAEDWLAKLRAALPPGEAPAIIGATGSWMSIRSAYAHLAMLPSGYRDALPSRRVVAAEMRTMNVELRDEGGHSAPAPLGRRLELATRRVLQTSGFPNPHIRTNGFLIPRKLFIQLMSTQPRDKLDAYALEAGPRSLTAQVLAGGGVALVVDRAGTAYPVQRWDRSGTLWQDAQERLLLADNQTRIYERGDHLRRRVLSGWAWGSATRADDGIGQEG